MTIPPIRDRIRELRRVPAGQLQRHPRNWRGHPARQKAALRSVLEKVGYADALLARELPDGSLQLIDGHLRAEATPETEVPVLVLDVTEEEANYLLATHDPLAAMAETQEEVLQDLIKDFSSEQAAVQGMWDELLSSLPATGESVVEVEIPELFQVVVECRDETDQRALFDRLRQEGRACRLLTL